MLLNGRAARLPRAIAGSALPLLAAALRELVQSNGYAVAGTFGDAAEARTALLGEMPELALFDFSGPLSGLDLLREARASGIATRIILFCDATDTESPLDAVELGVDGLLLRNASLDAVRHCIAAVTSGEQWLDPRAMKAAYENMARRQVQAPSPLTRREQDVARLVAAGQRNRVIAGTLGISEGTVKMHLHNVYAKLGLESRTQLAMDTRLREYA